MPLVAGTARGPTQSVRGIHLPAQVITPNDKDTLERCGQGWRRGLGLLKIGIVEEEERCVR
jgi:hypothetical protein